MSYELKSSINRNKLKPQYKIVIIITISFVILTFLFPNFFSNLFISIAKPIWNIEKGNEPEIQALLPETQNQIIAQLKKENKDLKEILGRKTSNNVILAFVLKKPPFTAYDSYILDIGSNQDISVGDKVYANGNILIGDIAEVYANTSKVRLYSSYGTKYDVLIGDKNIQASAQGGGGGIFLAVIPRDVKVAEGDTVSIPDISNSVFGTVGKIIIDPARAFSTVIFSQPINIYEQKWVLVSINKSK